MPEARETSVVEIKPEVVFLYEILQELSKQKIRIPRFQRAFVWRRDQMTELLDSIKMQYPIGSLLVWETDQQIATLDTLGPFAPVGDPTVTVGYLLDGHQRLMTLAGALLTGGPSLHREAGADGGKWEMFWNVKRHRFQHASQNDSSELLFPLTSLLDTVRFFEEIDEIREKLGQGAPAYVNEISALARTFQSYRVPVIRMRQTGLSEAVEIFARLNSRGQSMTADQMVSALTFRQDDEDVAFDLATEIDRMAETLSAEGFGDIGRGTVLRAILANLDEDIYKTDWTKLASERRDLLQSRLSEAVDRTAPSLMAAIAFLRSLGVATSRLLPYGLQLVLLSAFFDKQREPSPEQLRVLSRWFWVSSFSAWFGGANPSRISALIREFRSTFAADGQASKLENFDLSAAALPYPLNFDMRSARTRTLLLVMLDADPNEAGKPYAEHAIAELASRGPAALGPVFWKVPKEARGNPANRIFRAPSATKGSLEAWIRARASVGDTAALISSGVTEEAVNALVQGDALEFVRRRQDALISMETDFQVQREVNPSVVGAAEAPVDTE